MHVLLAEDKQGNVPNDVDKPVSQEGGSEETAIFKTCPLQYLYCKEGNCVPLAGKS